MMFCRILFFVSLFLPFLPVRGQEKKLEYFLQQGIKNSPMISDLNGQIRLNQVDSLLIKAMNKPRVEFRGYAFYAPVVNNIGYSEILTNIANLTSVMSVSQRLFNKKTIEANLLKTGNQKQSLVNTVHLTEISLKRALTAAYLDVWSTYSDISVDNELLSFAKEQGNLLKSNIGSVHPQWYPGYDTLLPGKTQSGQFFTHIAKRIPFICPLLS
jgi:hypothetical protein